MLAAISLTLQTRLQFSCGVGGVRGRVRGAGRCWGQCWVRAPVTRLGCTSAASKSDDQLMRGATETSIAGGREVLGGIGLVRHGLAGQTWEGTQHNTAEVG